MNIFDYSSSDQPSYFLDPSQIAAGVTPASSGGGGGSSGFSNLGADIGAVGSIAGGISGYLSSQATASGLESQSRAYTLAAGYAAGDVNIAEEMKAIKAYQTQRKVNTVAGSLSAGLGGAGFTSGGSGLSLMRENMQQGALATGMVNVQGEQVAQGYRAQQAADAGLASQAAEAASAASSAGTMDLIGGFLKGGAGLIGLLG